MDSAASLRAARDLHFGPNPLVRASGTTAVQLVTRCACCHWLWGQVVAAVVPVCDPDLDVSPFRPGYHLVPRGATATMSGSRFITGSVASACDDCGVMPICGPCRWTHSLTGRVRCCLCRRARLDEVSWHLVGSWRALDDQRGHLGDPTLQPPPSATLTRRDRRAISEYEWFHGLGDGEATFHQVRDSELGIDGWSAAALTRARVQAAALDAYEQFHGLQAGDASLRAVEESLEGLEGWAAQGEEFGRRATAGLSSGMVMEEVRMTAEDVGEHE